jgi:hypothetical protein
VAPLLLPETPAEATVLQSSDCAASGTAAVSRTTTTSRLQILMSISSSMQYIHNDKQAIKKSFLPITLRRPPDDSPRIQAAIRSSLAAAMAGEPRGRNGLVRRYLAENADFRASAQLVESELPKLLVAGSNPVARSTTKIL